MNIKNITFISYHCSHTTLYLIQLQKNKDSSTFFYSYLLSCTCIYDYMYRICSVAQRRIACSKATRNNSAHVIVDIFLVSGLPNCLCEGELDSAAMTPSWHMPRETICNNLCLLITNSYCWGQLFVYLLAFFLLPLLVLMF